MSTAATPLGRNRDFVALWVGQAVSNLGISISSFAYPLVVLDATGSPAKAGAVGSVLAGTAFFLRLPAGVLVDRWNRKAILVACDIGRAANAAVFAAALALGHFFLPHVLVVAFVEASLGVLFGPAETAAVRQVVARVQIRAAVARNQTRGALPGLLGPPLGGALLSLGRALPFLADAISYLVSLACVLAVRAPLQNEGPARVDPHPLRSVFDGVRWVWRRPFLRALLLWILGVGVAFNSIGLVTLVVARERGASTGQLGLMFAITSAGGVVGALAAPTLLRRIRPGALIVAFGWIAATATLLLRVAQSPYAIGALGALAFVLAPAVTALAFAFVAEHAPDEMQGRATSAGLQIASLGAPIGPLLAGVLLASVAAADAVLLYAGALLLLAALATLSRTLRSARVSTSTA